MTNDQIELAILRRFVEQYESAELRESPAACAEELDIRRVIEDLGVYSQQELPERAAYWVDRFDPPSKHKGLLLRCSDVNRRYQEHRFHLSAFTSLSHPTAWERIIELESRSPIVPEREREQKFRILYSPRQAELDFATWTREAVSQKEYSIGVLFLDIDDFKHLNEAYTHTVVDSSVLIPFQQLIASLCLHRGAGYRHGGEEFLVLLPNTDLSETAAFAEKFRRTIESTRFDIRGNTIAITVSVGVACWPHHGNLLLDVIGLANGAEQAAKSSGKNKVEISQ